MSNIPAPSPHDARPSRGRIVLSVNASWNVFNFRMGLIRRLMDEGYEVTVLAPRDEYSARLEQAGCAFIPLTINSKNTSPKQDLSLFVTYWRLIGRLKPVAYLGFTAKPNIYGGLAAQLRGVPVINNVSGLGTAFIRQNWVTTVVRNLYRIGLYRSHTVFFQNDDDRSLFISQRLVRDRIARLLPGSGISLTDFASQPMAVRDPASLRFLMIGRLLRDKGIIEYVDAARIVRARYPDIRFSLLGFLDSDNVSAVSGAEVDQWGREGLIDYLGVTDDVRPYIADSDCMVLPSYREGTPRTLLEAAAIGRPLIATDVPACREVVDPGVNGYLCQVRDAASLAERMIAFIELSGDERKKMAEASRRLVEDRFDERIVHRRYLEAIRATTA